MSRFPTLVLCAISLTAACTSSSPRTAEPAAARGAAAAGDRPIHELPYTPGLDVTSMDRTADPCVDFYQYSCGGWMTKNPIPSDQARWSVYRKLNDENQRYLWGILDQLSASVAPRSVTEQKIGDFFAACMDEPAIERRGLGPLEPALRRIDALTTTRDLPALLADLHLQTGDGGLLFSFGSGQDFTNAESVIAFASAGGLGLPDRDYYTNADAHSAELRQKYVAHVQRMFTLAGDTGSEAPKHAAAVMAFETALAKASLTQVEQRDPYKLFHRLSLVELQRLTPSFDWSAYLQALGQPKHAVINVTEPAFYRAVEERLKTTGLGDLKVYLRWHLIHADAAYLSTAFVNESFDFFSRALRGVPELRPRWKRCVSWVDAELGEALGQEFVTRTFSAETKQKTLRMTRQIEDAMHQDLEALTWMGPATRRHALEKLHAVVNKIGYPDRWRDYSSVEIRRDDFVGNVNRTRTFETRRQLAKIGKPLDRTEWQITPPTVDAYYDAQMNDVNFPAGVLQPPLFDPKMDDAPNYGNTGGTIGHELTHGFDDEGRQFDAKGDLRDWWTKQDAAAFASRAQCVVDQYAQYTVVDEVKINSKLTLGEDVADLGGMVLAWLAWKAQTVDEPPASAEGFTPEQRFFVGFAQWACENTRPADLRANAITNPHSPGRYRINGVVVNMPEFQQAFQCKPGQPMVKENRCRIW